MKRRSAIRNAPWALFAPLAWMLAFVVAPFVLVVRISLSEKALAQPPYRPVFDVVAGWEGLWAALGQLSLSNYASVFDDDLLFDAFFTSIRIAGVSTLITLLIGLAIAAPIARASKRWQTFLVMLLVLPFLTSFLIRSYAWIAILKPEGHLNRWLMETGLISQPLLILNTEWAIIIGIVYSYLPFMALPLYASLEKADPALLEAAADLGARPLTAFFLITVPSIMPGILAGCALVFIPAMGEFIIPDLLGGSDTLMIGRVIWNEFFANRDWPLASAIAVLLLVIVLMPVLLKQRKAVPA